MDPGTSARPNWREVAAAVCTGVLHLAFKSVGLHGTFVLIAGLGWAAFVIRRASTQRGILLEWGFRADNLLRAFGVAAFLSLPAFVAMALIPEKPGNLQFCSRVLPLLVLYPVWGVIQQFLVQGLVVRNVTMTRLGSIRPLVVIAGASLFALVHVPQIPLMVATFAMGVLFVPLYLAYHNLWPLGVFHGWLGAMFYAWVLHQDPWSDFLATVGPGILRCLTPP